MTAYRIHFETDRFIQPGYPFFACGRAQQMFTLRTSRTWSEVTCLACLKHKPATTVPDRYHIEHGVTAPMIPGMGMMPAYIRLGGSLGWYRYWMPRVCRMLVRTGQFRDGKTWGT